VRVAVTLSGDKVKPAAQLAGRIYCAAKAPGSKVELTADGFSVATAIAAAGDELYWLAIDSVKPGPFLVFSASRSGVRRAPRPVGKRLPRHLEVAGGTLYVLGMDGAHALPLMSQSCFAIPRFDLAPFEAAGSSTCLLEPSHLDIVHDLGSVEPHEIAETPAACSDWDAEALDAGFLTKGSGSRRALKNGWSLHAGTTVARGDRDALEQRAPLVEVTLRGVAPRRPCECRRPPSGEHAQHRTPRRTSWQRRSPGPPSGGMLGRWRGLPSG
jgi:hypothetical protein